MKRKQRLSNILYDELVKKREKCSDKKRIEYKKKEQKKKVNDIDYSGEKYLIY